MMQSECVFHANIRTLVQIPRTHLKVVSGAHTYNPVLEFLGQGQRQADPRCSERRVYSRRGRLLTGRHPLASTLTHPASIHTHTHTCLYNYTHTKKKMPGTVSQACNHSSGDRDRKHFSAVGQTVYLNWLAPKKPSQE